MHSLQLKLDFFFRHIASVTPAIFVLAATYAECNEVLVVTLLMISIGSQGLMTCGIVLNPMDLSPMFASTLSGLMNCISTFTGILAPYVVGALTPNVRVIHVSSASPADSHRRRRNSN